MKYKITIEYKGKKASNKYDPDNISANAFYVLIRTLEIEIENKK